MILQQKESAYPYAQTFLIGMLISIYASASICAIAHYTAILFRGLAKVYAILGIIPINLREDVFKIAHPGTSPMIRPQSENVNPVRLCVPLGSEILF